MRDKLKKYARHFVKNLAELAKIGMVVCGIIATLGAIWVLIHPALAVAVFVFGLVADSAWNDYKLDNTPSEDSLWEKL